MSAVTYAVARGVLGGSVTLLLSVAVGLLTCYVVGSLPKRSLEHSAILQARDAPILASSAAVHLRTTGSRTKTLLALRSDEPRLVSLLEQTKKRVLLGVAPATELADSNLVRADSIAGILASVCRAHGDRLDEEGEELEGMVRSSQSSEESKFPVFLTLSFFLPIMLMLLAAIDHHDDPVSIVSLTFLEVVVLDLALAFASTERRRLSN